MINSNSFNSFENQNNYDLSDYEWLKMLDNEFLDDDELEYIFKEDFDIEFEEK